MNEIHYTAASFLNATVRFPTFPTKPCEQSEYFYNTSLAAKGALQNPKWPPEGSKMADGVWKGIYP